MIHPNMCMNRIESGERKLLEEARGNINWCCKSKALYCVPTGAVVHTNDRLLENGDNLKFY